MIARAEGFEFVGTAAKIAIAFAMVGVFLFVRFL